MSGIGQVQPLGHQAAPAVPAAAQPAAPARPQNGRRPLAELIVVSIGIAATAIYSPTFAFGLAVGAVENCVIGTIALGLSALIGEPPPPEEEGVIESSLLYPVGEELIFRGCLQPFLESELVKNLPNISYAFLGAQITLATITAIAITAILFGAGHLGEDGALIPIFATLGGLTMGYIRSRYGLLASIGQHIAFNHLISCAVVIAGRPNPAPAQ